jgi:hypothetical protein
MLLAGAVQCQHEQASLLTDCTFHPGDLDSCFLEGTYTEVFLGNNELSGTLPDVDTSTPLRVFHAPDQRGGGFTGPVPSSYAALSKLQELHLGANSLTGPLPDIKETSLKYFNVSANNMEGPLEALPEAAWVYDFSDNGFSGKLPKLEGAKSMEAFVASGNEFVGSIPGKKIEACGNAYIRGRDACEHSTHFPLSLAKQ